MGSGTGVSCAITLNTTLTPEQQTRYQNATVIRRALDEARTIAIYGLSSDKQKASYFVGSYLQSEGYRIIPINPGASEILGEKSYPDLLSVPEKVDIVDIFRPPGEIPAIVDQAIAKKVPLVWMQLRLIHLPAAEKAEAAGLSVVVDRCIKMEHGGYRGSLHWAGMNTELISARKGR